MLTTDMLENILANADNPGALSRYLTRQMRELLGGRIVALIECECVSKTSRHRIVNVFPERHKDVMDCPEADELASLAHDFVRAQLWGCEAGPERARAILKEKGWGDTIMLPLTFGKSRFGVLFVFGLMDLNNAANLLNTLETLTHIIALVLKNSIQFENLENIIAERTAEISEKERQFRTLAAATPVGIVTIDARGVITFANRQAEKILGLVMPVGGELTYNSPAWRVTDVDGGPFDEEKLPFSVVMATGRPADDIRHAIEWPDGKRVLISVNAVPQFGEAGKITGVIAAITDITERIKAEKAIIQARDQAEAANKAKSMFLANMSHELRTPMNGIIGFSSLLSISGLNEEQDEFNEMIKTSALHLLELINDMLDFSRLDVKKIKLDNKPFDICAVVKNSRSLIYRQLKNKSMGLEYEIDERINYKVIGDQLRVKQVLLNLLTNAVKFSQEGIIKIILSQKCVKEDTAFLSITVSDQ
ncbi:MAG TPA: histidine kinase dimerization/phospho-acceptor domain-containing protein, partial [Candidatus Wallbacteria bacterium]|nr:histidine kinase dimerization/phospho-acceptor domain-containing protein [Candidatus Wallbacteria bacterium]